MKRSVVQIQVVAIAKTGYSSTDSSYNH